MTEDSLVSGCISSTAAPLIIDLTEWRFSGAGNRRWTWYPRELYLQKRANPGPCFNL